MRVALVHDYLTHFGGAERVLLALMDLFPNAPVYTLIHDSKAPSFQDYPALRDTDRIRSSFLQRIPGATRAHRYWPLALMPAAVERFQFSDFDVVLSTSHSFSKGIITGPNTTHISYCFTPTRYAWDDSHRYVREFSQSRLFQRFAPIALSYIRLWDYFAAQRPDAYVTISNYVAGRIQKYYGRSSDVVYPPVSVKKFPVYMNHHGYYLVVSRLVPYKRIDIAIRACEELGRPLKVVGSGPELESLKRLAGTNTEFLGFVPDKELPSLYGGAKALLFPQEEDFGIAPLEAAACGTPTIAYNAGGAAETVVDGKTGVLFNEQSSESLKVAITGFEGEHWNPLIIRSHAEKFDTEHFLRSVNAIVHNTRLGERAQ